MKRLILIGCAVIICSSTAVFAQQAGENINVLPVVSPALFPDDWWLLGDGYLQRQVEPTIAGSTRNPDHLLAFFNDYRAVDVPPEEDIGLGESQNIVAMAFKAAQTLMAAFYPWSHLPNLPIAPPVAAAEAWVGMSRSYDGGLTWSGGFLPGAPFDGSPQSLLSPVHGLEAATDPVLVAGPCGTYYVAFIAFTRGDESRIAVARYEDLNNNPGGDTIVYLGTTVLETGNNAEYGYFLDKPDVEIDIMRPEDPQDLCAHRLYVSYSTFNGLSKDGKFQSKINFAKSEDGGMTFVKSKIQQPYTQNQGSTIAVDPRPGMPNESGGGGTVYLVWRHFFDPDAMVMIRTQDFGKRWTKPIELTNSNMAPFDQPTISTVTMPTPVASSLNPYFPELAFRSNGFPTAAVAADGTVFAAWQERVNLSTGMPDAGGSPRIVLTSSNNGGVTWTGREAVDFSDRDVPPGSLDPGLPPAPIGFGTLPLERPSGPQVMPQLSFGGGRLMLAYYESRGRIGNYGSTDTMAPEYIESEPLIVDQTPFITGYDRLLDFRAALLNPTTGQFISSAQVSRYPLSAGANLGDGEDLIDVAPINPPCAPDHVSYYPEGTVLPPCVRQVNRANAPTSAAGTSPFIGDYPGLEPFVSFVVDGYGHWRWATLETDLTTPGFHSIWTDNRHLIPPQTGNPATEWQEFVNYDEPGGTSCTNPGSRNTDVLTSRVDAELVISSPTTYRLTGNQPARFPFSISNQTAETRSYTLTIDSAIAAVSFLPLDVERSLSVDIFPYSSTAQVVYVPMGEMQPVTVNVVEVESCSGVCQTGSITFNAADSMANFDDGTPTTDQFFNPTINGDAFVINYNLDNAFVINEGAENAFVINPTVDNAFVINPTEENAFVINAFVINAFVINAFVINPAPGEEPPLVPSYYDVHDVVETTWTVTPGESTEASSFLPLINIDNAEYFLDNYVFQLFVHKGSLYGTLGLESCEPANVNQTQILSTFAQGPNTATAENAFVINPTPENAFVINEGLDNAFVINSTFTMAPSDDAPETNSTSFAKNGSEYVPNDGTLKGPRAPDHVNITLRAYQIKPDIELPIDPITGDRYKYNPDPATGGSLPSATVMELSCDPETDEECVDKQGPDLIVVEKDDLEIIELSAAPCGTVDFPAFTLRNQGYKDAIARRPLNEDYLYPGIMRHAIYLSSDMRIDPTDRILTAESFNSEINPLGGENDPERTQPFDELFDLTSVTLPPDVTGGTYYLILFVDYAIQVSEYDETNNTVVIKLVVNGDSGPSYVFGGQPPLVFGSVHTANSGSALPLLWQYLDLETLMPFDSADADPVIEISGWPGSTCGDQSGDALISIVEDPGSSDYRYKESTFTHQFNWQTKKDNLPLPAGCYEVSISNSYLCGGQADGPFLIQLN